MGRRNGTEQLGGYGMSLGVHTLPGSAWRLKGRLEHLQVRQIHVHIKGIFSPLRVSYLHQ